MKFFERLLNPLYIFALACIVIIAGAVVLLTNRGFITSPENDSIHVYFDNESTFLEKRALDSVVRADEESLILIFEGISYDDLNADLSDVAEEVSIYKNIDSFSITTFGLSTLWNVSLILLLFIIIQYYIESFGEVTKTIYTYAENGLNLVVSTFISIGFYVATLALSSAIFAVSLKDLELLYLILIILLVSAGSATLSNNNEPTESNDWKIISVIALGVSVPVLFSLSPTVVIPGIISILAIALGIYLNRNLMVMAYIKQLRRVQFIREKNSIAEESKDKKTNEKKSRTGKKLDNEQSVAKKNSVRKKSTKKKK